MTQSKYPLIEAMGLKVEEGMFEKWHAYNSRFWVDADDLERALEKAHVVYGQVRGDFGWFDRPLSEHPAWQNGYHNGESTHTARLLCIELIQEDTAESLLREWIALRDGEGSQFLGMKASLEFNEKCDDHEKRVRKLLEGK